VAGDATVVLVGGKIFTSSKEAPWAKALAVRGDRILAVGTDSQAERWNGRGTRSIDLRGRTVVPGFIDAHTHLASSSRRIGWTDLSRARSLEEAVRALRAAATRRPAGTWVLATDWDESKWPERRYLTRADLDRATTDRPVFALRIDKHLSVVNSRGLESAADLSGSPGLETGNDGRPTGLLKEEASRALWLRVDGASSRDQAHLASAVRRMHRLGITSVHDVVDQRGWQTHQRAHREGRLEIRVRAMLRYDLLPHLLGAGFMTGLGDAWLRLGAVKFFADGSLGARTAFLREPYADAADRGRALHSPEEMRSLISQAHAGGLQTATHAIGDAAIDLVLDALESLEPSASARAARHRIEHFGLPHEDSLRRMKAGRFVASCQPNFLGGWTGAGNLHEARLGPDRAKSANSLRAILRQGIPLAFGSDGMPYGPLNGIHWAVNASSPELSMSVEEAVRAYTAGGAYAGFEEDVKGILAPGKLADFVILQDDLFDEPARIRDRRIHSTWVGGRVVYRVDERHEAQ
jgi:predicted amidohydrolase YtcJ